MKGAARYAVKQVLAEGLTYFSVINSSEADQKRKELAYRAGRLVKVMVEEVGETGIVKRNVDDDAKAEYANKQYALAKDYFTADKPRTNSSHVSRKIVEDSKDSLSIAKSLDEFYAEANSITKDLLEHEAVSDKPDEEVDYEFLSGMLYQLNVTFLSSLDIAYAAWLADFATHKKLYFRTNPASEGGLSDCEKALYEKLSDKSALMMAGNQIMMTCKKVTSDELSEMVKGYRSQIDTASSNLESQLEQVLSNETSQPDSRLYG